MQSPPYYDQLCQKCEKIVNDAITTNTQEGYVLAQQLLKAELAKKSSRFNPAAFQMLADLKSNHEQVFIEFICQCEEKRELLFSTEINQALESGDLLVNLLRIKYTGYSSTFASRVIHAAKRGDLEAKMIFTLFSSTEEEKEERIPVKIVPQDKL
jgi:UPF0288 family protein (methanogenesis marker protein 3)